MNWFDTVEFCNRLSQAESLIPQYLQHDIYAVTRYGTGYQLPTEAEWEYACRGGTTGLYSSGSWEAMTNVAWTHQSGPRTHAVGELLANPFGLFDMHGNVWEWVRDGWVDAAYQRPPNKGVVNPLIEFSDGSVRILRGGRWNNDRIMAGSSIRLAHSGVLNGPDIGFRVSLPWETVRDTLAKAAPPASVERETWHGWPKEAPPPAISPFDAVQARQHQEAWAAYLKVPVEYTNSIGMRFRLIPPGEYFRGNSSEEIERLIGEVPEIPSKEFWTGSLQRTGPRHRTVLTQPFFLAVTEVTQAEYKRVVGTNPSAFSPEGSHQQSVAGLDTSRFPVEMVTWGNAVDFCNRLGELESLTPNYKRAGEIATPLKGTSYHLPTEAEWEFACRAGSLGRLWSGEMYPVTIGWVWQSGGRTHAVGELPANPFGLMDVHGNVWECTRDNSREADYERYRDSIAIDPLIPFDSNTQRTLRGGRWSALPYEAESATRLFHIANLAGTDIGFRVSLSWQTVQAAVAKNPPAPATEGWHGWPKEAPPPAIAPFNSDQARQHQEAWAAYLSLPAEFTNSLGMTFRLIPPGEFPMGSTEEEILADIQDERGDFDVRATLGSELPRHTVLLTQPYYMATHEVTQHDFTAVLAHNTSHYAQGGPKEAQVANTDTSRHPVEGVSWHLAGQFCTQLSQNEGRTPRYFHFEGRAMPLRIGNGYRLPTEAEWEFACRAGTNTRFWFGDNADDLSSAAWNNVKNVTNTTPQPVGVLRPNPWGLFDILGNVWEWTQDAWDPGIYTRRGITTVVNPLAFVDNDNRFVFRGGSHRNLDPLTYRSARRYSDRREKGYPNVGFRICLPIEPGLKIDTAN